MIFFPSPSSYFLSQKQMRSFYGSYKRLEFAFGGSHACSLAKAAADVLLLFFISKLAALHLLPEDSAGAKKLDPHPPTTNKVNDEVFLRSAGEGRKERVPSARRNLAMTSRESVRALASKKQNARADSG